MFNKINDFIDRDTEEKYLERYAPTVYKKIRSILGLLFILFVGAIAISGWNIFAANKQKQSDLYSIDLDTKKISRINYSYFPSYSKEKFSYFISSILEGMFTTNFASVDSDLKKHRKYFTEKAWDVFEIQFANSFSSFLKENSLLSNLTITTPPVLISQARYIATGRIERVYILKGFISYKGSIKNKKNTFPISVSVTVLGVGSKESPYGLSIDSINVRK